MKITTYIFVLVIAFVATMKSQDSLSLNLPDFQINENIGSTAQSYVYPVALSKNNFVLYWRDARNGNVKFPFPAGGAEDLYSQTFDTTGTRLGSNVFLKTFDMWLKIASNHNGTNIKFFYDNKQFFLQKLDFNLTPVSDTVQINTQNFVDVNGVQYKPTVNFDLAVKGNGNFLSVWQAKKNSLHNWEIYGQKFNSQLQAIDENKLLFEKRLNGDYDTPFVKVNSDSNFVIASAGKRNNLKSIYVQIYSDTLMFSTAIVANDFANGIYANSNPSIGISSNGFNVVWLGTDNQIYVQKFSNAGEKIGGNIIVNKNNSSVAKFYPYISSSLSGHSIITWSQGKSHHYLLFAQLLDSLNNPILPADMLISDNFSFYWQDSKILTLTENNFLVTWDNWSNGKFLNVHFKILNNNGSVIKNEIKVNDDIGSSFQFASDIKTKDNFNFAVWQDERKTKYDIFFRSFSSNGINPEVNVSERNIETNSEPTISILPDNNVLVAWDAEYIISAQLLDKYGAKIDDLLTITDEGLGSWLNSPRSAVNKNGRVLIVWETQWYAGNNIAYQLLDNKINKIGVNIVVNNPKGVHSYHSPDCFINKNNEFYICWFSKNPSYYTYQSDIILKKFLDSDNPAQESFIVNEANNKRDIYNFYPRIASNPSTDNFVITWESNKNGNFDIYAQMFDKKGSFIGSNFIVNDDLNGAEQKYPVVAMDKNDNFVIAWEDYRNGNSDIYAQIFLANGNSWGKNFLVNKDTLKEQFKPSVSVNDNDIHFSWTTNHVGGTGFDIWTNAYKWDEILDVNKKSSIVDLFTVNIYPNPFNSATTIKYFIPKNGLVEILLYNSLGQKLELLENSLKNRGSYNLYFSPNNLSSGIYFVVVNFEQQQIATKKIIYLK